MTNTQIKERQFKTMAKDAVSRMKHGFWEDMLEKKKNGELEKEKNKMTSQEKSQIERTVILKSDTQKDDEEFEKRVYALLDEDEISPIGKLMDKEKYVQMTLEERGRYVLAISNKFLKVKEKYEAEKRMKQKYAKSAQFINI